MLQHVIRLTLAALMSAAAGLTLVAQNERPDQDLNGNNRNEEGTPCAARPAAVLPGQ